MAVAASSPVDTQQQRLLERLREAGGRPVTFSELHAAGVDFPAAVVNELELAGYSIDRVSEAGRALGVRLLEPEHAGLIAAPARRRWPWLRRSS
jgi:hypothetical protein